MPPLTVFRKILYPSFTSLISPKPKCLLKTSCSQLFCLDGKDRYQGEHSRFSILLPSFEWASLPFFGVPRAYLPVILSSKDHRCLCHLEDRKWILGEEDGITTIENSKSMDIKGVEGLTRFVKPTNLLIFPLQDHESSKN